MREEEEEEQEPPPPADELAEPLSTRLPPSIGSSAGDAFGESGCGTSPAGNRWPRQETMALLKIRSDMDPLFQEATLKAPLWEELARKLAGEGYRRSAKKCKEKFENVFKYYKRTKEARAGKSYRFFSQLEALRSSSAAAALPTLMASSSAAMLDIEASSSGAAAPSQHATLFSVPVPPPVAGLITTRAISPPPTDAADGPSSSSNTSSYSGTESDDENLGKASRKRKRKFRGGGKRDDRDKAPGHSGKMMAFFEGLIQKVMDQQEKMLQRFLEAIERREQNRMIREEAWRRQEKSRLSREHELAAQERAAAASRDDAIISFLQKLTGRKIRIPTPPLPPQTTIDTAQQTPTSPPPPPPPPPQVPDQPPKEMILGSSIRGTAQPISSSRWPKSEVHALIKLRSGMESRYQESIPKGPLWEEISTGMACLGYNRSAKRCKEKWENINKYFKKVKEGNKNRAEDAKTCPYFHQLEALYRNKLLGGSSAARTASQVLSAVDQLALISPTTATTKQQDDRLSFFEQGPSSVSPVKKPEDIMMKMKEKMMMKQQEKGFNSFRIGELYMMPRVLGAGTGQNNLLAMVR